MDKKEKLRLAREYEKEESPKIEREEKPSYHMSVPIGWMNDPNGFSVFQGTCHLFFQYHPYSKYWGPMHWGHVTTRDFIQWESSLTALAPDMDYDSNGCFSGSALEWNGEQVLMYTGVEEFEEEDGTKRMCQTQCIAIGDGKDYKKLEENPVIVPDALPIGSSKTDFRDPKLWRDEQGFWSLVGSLNEDGSGQLALFHSRNMIDWSFVKILDQCKYEYGKMWECPDFFPLDGRQVLIVSPQFMKSDGREFHNGSNSIYFVGDYDAKTQKWSRKEAHMIDFGLDFYAPQTLQHTDGRQILIGWMESWDNSLVPEEYRWSGTMTIPRELSLKGEKLLQNPVQELLVYRKNQVKYMDYILEAKHGKTEIEGIYGRCVDMELHLSGREYRSFLLTLAADETHETLLRYEQETGKLTIDRTRCGMCKDLISIRSIQFLEEERELVKFRILLDKNSIEVFVNDGAYVMSTLIYTPKKADKILFQTDGKMTLTIEKYDILV